MIRKRENPAAAATAGGDDADLEILQTDDNQLYRPTQLRRAFDRSKRVAFVEREGRQLGMIVWHHELGWCATSSAFGVMGNHTSALRAARIIQRSQP